MPRQNYTFEEQKAFWERDVRGVKQTIYNFFASILQNPNWKEVWSKIYQEKTFNQAFEEEFNKVYPNGTGFKYGEAHCPTCTCALPTPTEDPIKHD